MSNQPKCWWCQQPLTGNSYSLTYGQPGTWDRLGYFDSRECLAQWVTQHWENL